jgi:predicted RNA-binding protein with PUA-like domain
MNYWLFKSEPSTFSIDDLSLCTNKTEHWDGVRNYQARNFMKDMKKSDLGFFYHSSCKVPGVAGVVKVTKEAYPDHTSWNKKSPYYDEKSSKDNPRWFMVDVKLVKKFKTLITLEELKSYSTLKDFKLLQKGNRLSILPVTKKQWDFILEKN